MDGLHGVRVGDEVILVNVQKSGPLRAKVEVVGRKFVTVKGQRYLLNTGQQDGTIHGYARQAYTLPQWERREAGDALRVAVQKFCAADLTFGHMQIDEIREATLMVESMAAKLTKKKLAASSTPP